MTATVHIPTQFSDITPEWLTTVLAGGGHLPAGRVTSVSTEGFGEGVGLMGKIARLHVQYEGASTAAPASFVVKIPTDPGPNRQMSVDYRIYEKEVWFYERLAGQAPVRTARVYHSAFNPENHDFVLLLEDLAPARVGSELVPPADGHVRVALREIARFHARWWDSDEVRALDWIPYLNSPIYRQHTQLFAYGWPLWKEKFGPEASAYVLAAGERLGERLHEFQDALCSDPVTIMHMDYRLPNLFFPGPEGGVEFAIVDWQPYARCRGLYDVGYFMAQSVPTEQRRRLEDEVLHLYHDTLLANGVRNYGYDRCFHDYRMGVMYTFLYSIGTVTIDLANDTGRAYQRTITDRHMAAVEDLKGIEVIP